MPDQGTTSFIREFGFPIFVCVWFMWRIEKRLDRFLELLTGLLKATALLAKSVEHIDTEKRGQLPPEDTIDSDGEKE